MPIGDFPKSLSQAMLVGIMLVGRLGVVVVFLLGGVFLWSGWNRPALVLWRPEALACTEPVPPEAWS